MILLAFIAGVFFTVISFAVAYIVLREIIYKYGKVLRGGIENELNKLVDKTTDGTQIVYPDLVKEMFDKEGSTLADNIR